MVHLIPARSRPGIGDSQPDPLGMLLPPVRSRPGVGQISLGRRPISVGLRYFLHEIGPMTRNPERDTERSRVVHARSPSLLSSLASISSPAFLEFIGRLPTLPCADCHIMQLPRRPFIEPFWNRPLCDACRMDDKYRLVMAYTAKKNYFLDENDLLGLRTFSQRNRHHKNASHVRFFSRVDVQRRSELKLR